MAQQQRDVRPRKPGGRRKAVAGEEYLTTRPGSPVWHYSFTIEGHRLRASCGTADHDLAAAFAAREYEAAYRRIALGERPAARLTLEEAAVHWWQDRGQHTAYGPNGQRHQVARMIRILGGATALSDLDNATVARLVRGLRAGEGVNEGHEARGEASPATVNRYLATLSVLCTYAKEVHGAEVGPWSKKPHLLREPEGKERFLTPEEARAVCEALVPHARAPVTLALATGARKRNWLHLTWEEVSLDLGRALVRGKGDRPLHITLPPAAVNLLAWLQPDPAERRGRVFRFGDPRVGCACTHCVSRLYAGQPIQDIKRAWKTATKVVGVPEARLHDLRHSFASWVLAATGDLRLVQEALGHREIATTTRYARLMPGRREAGIAAATAALEMPVVAPAKKESA